MGKDISYCIHTVECILMTVTSGMYVVNAKRHRQPMECEDQVVAAPRCAGVVKVVLRSHKTPLRAVKHDGSVE